jgi:hypothetical protein
MAGLGSEALPNLPFMLHWMFVLSIREHRSCEFMVESLHIFIKKIDESRQAGPVSFVPKLQGCPIAVPGSRHIEG